MTRSPKATDINTPAEILTAFRACNDPGEEIELFECLATRPHPPVDAFVELLKVIKLERILALTIQAFGNITNSDIKAHLKESTGLLEMLSQKAESGANDLIKWSAAMAIEKIGYDFLMVAQYLSEDPKKLAERIVNSKIKTLEDQKVVNSNDYSGLVCFWTYGPLEKLRGDKEKLNLVLMNGSDKKLAEGNVYVGQVTRIFPSGACVKLPTNQEGMIHISRLANHRVGRVEDQVSIGDEVIVRVVEIDSKGRINLTRIGINPEEIINYSYPDWAIRRLTNSI